jgi:hypothetical protein
MSLTSADALLAWALRSLPTKNKLEHDDARAVEAAFEAKIAPFRTLDAGELPGASERPSGSPVGDPGLVLAAEEEAKPSLTKTTRRRDKKHLAFVASQPCLACGRSPCDAHHLRFAEPRALGKKVSDEFTVPLCRVHHRKLHARGDELAWWSEFKIDPASVAERLWAATR